MLRSTAPISVYRSQAARFNTQRALSHIEQLASPAFEGRESGTAGAAQAADYIAAQMKEIGLAPGGTDGDYRLAMKRGPYRLNETPRLEIIAEDDGTVIEALTYREDFLALKGPSVFYDACEGRVMGLALGPHPERPEDEAPASDADAVKLILPGSRLGRGDPYGLRNLDLYDKIFLVREEDVGYVNMDAAVGLLIIGNATPTRTEGPLRLYVHRGKAGDVHHTRGSGSPVAHSGQQPGGIQSARRRFGAGRDRDDRSRRNVANAYPGDRHRL